MKPTLLFSALLLCFTSAAEAALITNGFTYAVASSSSDTNTGNHFHSNTGGAFGNPAGKAEVGRFSTEEVRGLSEYDITGLSAVSSAFVTFNVFDNGGLFDGSNDFPFDGNISVYSYVGNNTEDVSDYQAASTGTVGTFSTLGLGVGNIISFDITSLLNAAILAGNSSLGMRLQADPLNSRGAWTFDSFRLTTDSLCSVAGGCNPPPVNEVPVPAALPLMASGLALLGFGKRKKAKLAANA